MDVRQKLRQRFASAGLTEFPPNGASPEPDLLFQAEGVRVCMVILESADWADRQALLDSLMRASALAGRVNRTYLVIPRSTASLVDARVFQGIGIGLFTYDQRNVEEALPARYFEAKEHAYNATASPLSTQLQTELHELRIQFDSLESIVRQLKEELASVREARTPGGVVRAVPQPNSAEAIGLASGLPGFLTGNPWVEVLSRRGREENTIAG